MLQIISWNCRGFPWNKGPKLSWILNEVDIILLVETWEHEEFKVPHIVETWQHEESNSHQNKFLQLRTFGCNGE